MNQGENRRYSRKEVTLQNVFIALKKRLVIICIVAILFSCGAWAYTKYFITPVYATQVSFCVFAGQRENDSITSGELNSDAATATTYSLLLTSQPIVTAVSDALNGEISAGAIHNMLSAEVDSQIIYVTVRGTDPLRIVRVANAMLDVAPSSVSALVRAGEMVAVDRPTMPSAPIYPNTKSNIVMGFMIGLLLASAVVVAFTLFDTTVWREEDLERVFHIPVLGRVPNMLPKAKSGAKNKKQGR